MVGCLIHLATQTQPELILSATQLSRRDVCAVDRVLRYVAGTVDVGQTYCSYGLSPELCTTVDVSYNCHADSKSHTGVTVHYGRFSTPFIPMSKKQSIIADSSTAAEFIGTHTGERLSCGCMGVIRISNLSTNCCTAVHTIGCSPLAVFVECKLIIRIMMIVPTSIGLPIEEGTIVGLGLSWYGGW